MPLNYFSGLTRKVPFAFPTRAQCSVHVLEIELRSYLLRYLRLVIHNWCMVVRYWQLDCQLQRLGFESPRTSDTYVSEKNRGAPIAFVNWSLPDTSLQVIGEGRSHNGFTMIDPSVDVPSPTEMRLA